MNTNNQIEQVLPGTDCLTNQVWQEVNRNYICKSITELMHELLLVPQEVGREGHLVSFQIKTTDHHITYSFQAEHRLMDFWHIHRPSLRKTNAAGEELLFDGALFFVEFQDLFEIKPFTLTHFIEETNNTLYADAYMLAKGRLTADQLAEADYQTVEHRMEGHPWATVNKGRIGFDLKDYQRFVPEADQMVKLAWLAVHSSRAAYNSTPDWNTETLYRQELGDEKLVSFRNQLIDVGLNPADYHFLPIHQWQWENKLVFQFAADIASKLLIPMGLSDDRYTPQQSIRTFFNVDNPNKLYVKTAISILNTSVYRGLSPDKLAIAPTVTAWAKQLLADDEYLKQTQLTLLGEVASVGYRHPLFNQLAGVPYQYKDLLGVIWRESADSHIKEGEKLVTMASLLYIDNDNKPYIAACIEKSGLTAEAWLRSYLKAYLKPILHIFYQHGFFFSPHGENTILVMKDYVPQRIIIKDFVEEIVLTQAAKARLSNEIQGILREIDDELAPLFILSGVFDALYRYLSNILHTYMQLPEQLLWQLVAETIQEYQTENPALADLFKQFDLFVPEFIRVCINRVRLLTYGYGENTEIPMPEAHGMLENPIADYKI